MQEAETHLHQEYIIVLNETICDGCRMCLPACNYGAMIWVPGERVLLIDSWACTGCGSCTTACPNHALILQARAPR